MTGMSMPRQEWYLGLPGYLRMWMTMMVPMMLPSLVPMVSRYRRSVPADGLRRHGLTALVGVGYFAIWACLGVVVYGAESGFKGIELGRDVPVGWLPGAAGVVLLAAGAAQLSRWKARQLALCRGEPGDDCHLGGDRPERLSARARTGPPLQPCLRPADAGAARDRNDGAAADGGGDARDHGGAARSGTAAGRPAGRAGDPGHRDGDSGARVAAVEPGLGPLPWPRGREPRSLHASSYPHAPRLLSLPFRAAPPWPRPRATASGPCPRKDYAVHQVQPAGPDHPRQRDPPPAGMDLLDRRPRRAPGAAAGRRGTPCTW